MTGIAPLSDIFDAPGISLCLNSEWASFIDAQVARLTDRTLWAGTEADVDRAVDQIEQFLAKLGDVGACSMTPVGAIMMHGAEAAPDGWLLCEGQAVSRTAYADLFAVVGETWGDGDGATTFNVPDFRHRSPMHPGDWPSGLASLGIGGQLGEDYHTLTVFEQPIHSHGVTDPGHIHTVTDPGHTHPQRLNISPAFQGGAAGANTSYGAASSNSPTRVNTDSAATGLSVNSHSTGIMVQNSVGDNPHITVHPVLGVPFIIFAGV